MKLAHPLQYDLIFSDVAQNFPLSKTFFDTMCTQTWLLYEWTLNGKKNFKHFNNSYILTLILQESEISWCILVFLDLKKFNEVVNKFPELRLTGSSHEH